MGKRDELRVGEKGECERWEKGGVLRVGKRVWVKGGEK
jgi:hypothetical protein